MRRGAVAMALMMLGVACGSGSDEDIAVGSSEGEVVAGAEGAELISFGSSLAQIRGHHLVSLELYEAGDIQGASTHAGHPVAEILSGVAAELEEHGGADAAEELTKVLDEGSAAIGENVTPAQLASIYDEAAAVTDEAAAVVVGDDVTSSTFRGSVIAALLSTAAHEYDEAVGGDGIRLQAEYQDGYAFVQESKRLYEEIVADVEAASVEEAEEIAEAFEVLDSAFVSAEAPKDPVDKLEVASAAELIGHELEETVDAEVSAAREPEAVAEEIEHLLDEIVETYAAGDADAAAELSAEAYLENYEVIEAEVIDAAPEVNEELEPLLGADLRKEILDGAPVEDIEAMIERAKTLLDEALEALDGAEH
jgi:hypothetical protein